MIVTKRQDILLLTIKRKINKIYKRVSNKKTNNYPEVAAEGAGRHEGHAAK